MLIRFYNWLKAKSH